MDITIRTVNDRWKLFTLTNDNGMEVQFLNYGGIITKILVPDKNQNKKNIVLGYADYKDYESDPNFLGAVIGPVAGRIKEAEFTLKNKNFGLEQNDGNHHLHGGSNAFHRVIWETETIKTDDKAGVTLSYVRKDGENGYPGNATVAVTYTLTNKNQLMIDYEATTDETTPITLTNHSYFNLTGDTNNTVHTHQLMVDSHQFLELNSGLIPTGKIIDATDSLFDFREGRELKNGMVAGSEQNKIVGNGYDHYFLFDHTKEKNVIVRDKNSGRVLTIETDQPGMVLYTGQNIVKGLELDGGSSKKYSGVCFETQSSPASLHHEGLPMIILNPSEIYKKQTTFSFYVE
ncbi:aldose epimerase family protein [Carnobacterium sp. FSL W8-0810]|uniref:aldose epimerase family protein n=1 Tax=Carnobacterium sp. FSL W8-0810 TaxID=2954705 RepID=UPI0030F72C1D